jgi:hypothetical protein
VQFGTDYYAATHKDAKDQCHRTIAHASPSSCRPPNANNFSYSAEPQVARIYLQETRKYAINATEQEKDWLVTRQFVTVLGSYLKGRNPTLRRLSSEIIEDLSRESSARSGAMMEEGTIGASLAHVAV